MKKKPIMKESAGKRCGVGANMKAPEKSKKAGRKIDSKQVNRTAGVPKAGQKIKVRKQKRTRRNQSEEFLKKYTSELKAIVNSFPTPQFVIDHDHRVLYWNRAMEVISGIKAEEVIGTKQHWKAFYKKRRPTLADMLIDGDIKGLSYWYGGKCSKSKYMAEAFECTDYFQNLGRKGIWLFFTAALIKDAAGAIIGANETIEDITERKHAEEALRESENKYRELVENANSIILRVNIGGTVTFFNEFAQNFFGYKANEILGKNAVGTIVPETDSSGKDMGHLIRDIAQNPEKYQSSENENMKKNGERVWVSWTNKIIQDNKGKVKEILCIGNDITGHKQSEDALKNSEIKFRELADFLPEIVFELDVNGNVTYINRVAYHLLGYTLDASFEGLNIFNILFPGDSDRVWRDFRSILNGARITGNEYMMRTKDRTTIHVIVHGRAIKLDGRITGVRGIIVDITDRKKAENAVRESEEKFRRLFEDSGIAQFLVDGDRIIDCNIEAMNMMGCREKNQLLQKFIHDLSPEVQPDGESSKSKVKKYAKLALQQRSLTFEWQYRRLGGELLTAEVVSTAIPMSGKTILHANMRDITEQKRLQNEIINIIDVEQQRLGQNLHDGLGQDLTGVAFMCNTLAKKLKELGLPESAISEEITSLVYHIITTVRTLSRELYPPNLVENEITYTLQQFAANTSSMFGISCTFNQDRDLVISNISVSTQIYYIVREAVNNSIKHGQAKHIIISLTHNKNDVLLVIEDDGIGSSEKMDKYKGLGLRIMAYRMGTMNGTFTIIDNYKSGGVVVFCAFPVYKLQKDH
jgi:PAS domain S-box-containing protein